MVNASGFIQTAISILILVFLTGPFFAVLDEASTNMAIPATVVPILDFIGILFVLAILVASADGLLYGASGRRLHTVIKRGKPA